MKKINIVFIVLLLIGLLCTAGCVTISSSGIALTGALSVSSTPTGASVYLDDQYKGTTPLSLENIPIGTYSLIVKKSGYDNWQNSVTINTGETITQNAKLTLTPRANVMVQNTAFTEHWSLSLGTYYTASFVVYNTGDATAKNVYLIIQLTQNGNVRDSETVYIGNLAPGEQKTASRSLDGEFGYKYSLTWSTTYQ